jgi:hypothetical protein
VEREKTLAGLEARLRRAVSAEEAWKHVVALSRWKRDSGSADERLASDYLIEQLKHHRIPVERHEFEAYLSWPQDAALDVLSPQRFGVPCRPRAFGASTPDGGIEGELVFVGKAEAEAKRGMIYTRHGGAADYADHDVRGKIVLGTGGGPDGVLAAQERGALALIHMWPSDEDVIHEMIVTSTWGTPTPESAPRLPTLPVGSIKRRDGERLRELLARGAVRVRLVARADRAWRRVPLVEAMVAGKAAAPYLLVGSHLDSWYSGTTDNATGDACLLELARVLHRHRRALVRSVRFCWWPGHSVGRYAGSTWYADTRFADLRANCIGYFNIDSPGVRNAGQFDCRYNMGEAERFMAAVVKEVTGQAPNIRRPFKAGDQSFWGVGLTSFGAFRMIPPEHADFALVGGSGGGWWWHSPEDTLDKGDATILADDTRLYVTAIARLLAAPVLPYEFVTPARDYVKLLTDLQAVGKGALDLAPLVARAEALRGKARALDGIAAAVARSGDPSRAEALNRGFLRLCRSLNPTLFTMAGDFDQDPAVQLPMLPGLQRLREWAALDPAADEARFLWTRLLRERNRTGDALERAHRELDRLLADLGAASRRGQRPEASGKGQRRPATAKAARKPRRSVRTLERSSVRRGR